MIHKLHQDGFFNGVDKKKKFGGSSSSSMTLVASNTAYKDGRKEQEAKNESFVKAAASLQGHHKEENRERQDQVKDDNDVVLTTSTTKYTKKHHKSVRFMDHHDTEAALKKHAKCYTDTANQDQCVIHKPSSPVVTNVYTRPYTIHSEKPIFYYSRKELQNFRQSIRVDILNERTSVFDARDVDNYDIKYTPLLQKILLDK